MVAQLRRRRKLLEELNSNSVATQTSPHSPSPSASIRRTGRTNAKVMVRLPVRPAMKEKPVVEVDERAELNQETPQKVMDGKTQEERGDEAPQRVSLVSKNGKAAAGGQEVESTTVKKVRGIRDCNTTSNKQREVTSGSPGRSAERSNSIDFNSRRKEDEEPQRKKRRSSRLSEQRLHEIKSSGTGATGNPSAQLPDVPPSKRRRSLRRSQRCSNGLKPSAPDPIGNNDALGPEQPKSRNRRSSLRLLGRRLSEANSEIAAQSKFQAVRGLHTGVISRGKIRSIDPLRCVSIAAWRIRKICSWGVRDLKRSFAGIGDTDSLIQGFVSCGKFSIVVQIPREYSFLLVEHFVEDGVLKEEADLLAHSYTWFHIVDGGHLHKALVQKMAEAPHLFGGFRWSVLQIEWQTPEVLKSLARICQEMQKEVHVIEFTLPEVMLNMRGVIDDILASHGILQEPGGGLPYGTNKKVLDAYTGGSSFGSSTLRALCSTCSKLSASFIREMATLWTEECDELLQMLAPKKPFGSDSRLFKKLLSTQSLKGAKVFLDAAETTDADRINVIHRMRYVAKTRQNFKSFSATEIDFQAKNAVAARKLLGMFEPILGDDGWPTEIDHLRSNLLRTTILDDDLEKGGGKDGEMFVLLKNEYISATGPHGRQRVSQYERAERAGILRAADPQKKTTNSAADVPDDTSEDARQDSDSRRERDIQGQDAIAGGSEGHNGSAEQHKVGGEDSENDGEIVVAACSQRKKSDGVVDENPGAEEVTDVSTAPTSMKGTDNKPTSSEDHCVQEMDDYAVIKEAGIEVHNVSYEAYERNSTEIGNSFDFIICDPFQKSPGADDICIDEKEAIRLLQFFRRVLVPGGYCFILLDWKLLREWASFLATSQFEVFKHPFRIVKDPAKFQRQRSSEYQDMVHDALVARKPGRHPSKFVWNSGMPYVNIPDCQFPRYCGVIDRVPAPSHRLTYRPTRAQVRPNEWCHDVFIEIIQTFCPEGGKVFDPSAGTLTTGIACAITGRSCVLLEDEDRCLQNAIPRLRSFVEANRSARCPQAPDKEAVEGNSKEVEGNECAQES